MTFEEQLVQLPVTKDIKETKLLKHARKAALAPDTGITINVKSAYAVIGDCATIASLYIPLCVYSKIHSPIIKLQNSFTKSQIVDLVERTKSQQHTNQLVQCIIYDIDTYINNRPVNAPTLNPFNPPNIGGVNTSTPPASDDVYGDYDRIDNSKSLTAVCESLQDKIIRVLNITKP